MNQADINAQMGPWTEQSFRRFAFRVLLLQRRGMSHEQAERWADRLELRDQQWDPRRICLECSNWQQSRTCFLGHATSPTQLVHCPAFNWMKPA